MCYDSSMRKVVTKSLAETHILASDFLESLRRYVAAGEGATVLALQGGLGAGKTAFVQGLAKALGIAERITSPTFVLMKRYETAQKKNAAPSFTSLVHIDAYRFEQPSEMEPLRWHELLTQPNTLIAIEWPEKVAGALPEGAHLLRFTFVDEATREITLPHD